MWRIPRQAAILALLTAAAAAIHAALAPPSPPREPDTIRSLSAAEALRRFEAGGDVWFIDARIREDYEAGHIPGAWWLPFSAFRSGRPAALDYFAPGSELIVYCEGGDCRSSAQLAETLALYGFSNLWILEEGWPGWEALGAPVESGPPSIEP